MSLSYRNQCPILNHVWMQLVIYTLWHLCIASEDKIWGKPHATPLFTHTQINRRIAERRSRFQYLLAPWSRVLLEKLTSKLCN